MNSVMEHYQDVAKRLEAKAPAQAKLLRYFIINEGQPKEAAEIARAMDCSESNFHVLAGKLRGRGVELTCTRTHAPGNVNEDVRFVYSVNTEEVADWETLRKKGIMTAWDRMSEMFMRSLENLGLPERAIGDVEGQMKAVKLILNALDFNIGRDYAAAHEALKAAEEAEREAAELEAATVTV